MIEEVAGNLYRVEIPLSGNPLKSINSYILKGQERNLIIDTGMNREECMKAMQAGLTSLGVDLRKTDFFITHFHVDHLGLVANLATDHSTIYLSQVDADIFHKVVFGTVWDDMIQYSLLNGLPENELREALPNHPARLYGVKEPLQFRLLKDEDSVGIEDYRFRCVETPGHTKGHMCLYEPHVKILISGDTLVQNRFLKTSCFGQHNEDRTMINPIMPLNTLFLRLLKAYEQSFDLVILDSKMDT